jgi:hypothetical protein
VKPHPNNACSGKYADWLEVNLLPECNGSCAWCIEQSGYHPTERAPWQVIADVAVATGKQNIILLGGEPTIHPHFGDVVKRLSRADRNVYVTTNGSMLSRPFVYENLSGVRGVNISIHNYRMNHNYRITGVLLDEGVLRDAIQALHEIDASARLNCNCIQGHVDSRSEMGLYIKLFAQVIGADEVRFAELKGDAVRFVDLVDVLGAEFGLSRDPFTGGCSTNVVMDGMPVNLRTLCGLQTPCRLVPDNPKQCLHGVLYYDGQLYDGWQRSNDEMALTREQKVERTIQALADGILTRGEATKKLCALLGQGSNEAVEEPAVRDTSSEGCRY